MLLLHVQISRDLAQGSACEQRKRGGDGTMVINHEHYFIVILLDLQKSDYFHLFDKILLNFVAIKEILI